MDKNDRMILVVPNDRLFEDDRFDGFRVDGSYVSRILANAKYMRRGDAERDETHKQPIA